ncbi:hypothetical protein [Serratia fonticola]
MELDDFGIFHGIDLEMPTIELGYENNLSEEQIDVVKTRKELRDYLVKSNEIIESPTFQEIDEAIRTEYLSERCKAEGELMRLYEQYEGFFKR